MGGNNGDLLVDFKVKDHPYFRRDGFNIHTTQLMPMMKAILGGTIEVPTIYGKRSIKLRPGTQSGAIIEISNHGLQQLYKNSFGSHYVHINIQVPTTLNIIQKLALRIFLAFEKPLRQDNQDIGRAHV